MFEGFPGSEGRKKKDAEIERGVVGGKDKGMEREIDTE